MGYKFCFEDKRKRSTTQHMILMMAKHGDHGVRHRFVSDADVKRFFQLNGYYWSDLLETCRKPKGIVPVVENFLGSTWKVTDGVKAAVVTEAATDSEKEVASVEGPGILTTSTYLQLFENALNNLHRSMETASFGDFQSCLSNGIASIDAYIQYRASLYNTGNPSEPLLDSKESKVSQDTKFDEWIPKMSGGKRLDKSKVNWQNFKRLRGVRGELAIHIKAPAFGINYRQLGELMNLFRSGIAGVLFDLHLLFVERIPSRIIRSVYLPDINLVEMKD